jgi:hypothetical protein
MPFATGVPTRMTTPPFEHALTYAEDLRPEDVRALEAFLNVQLGRVYEEVGETGETSFAMRSLLILVCDSAGLLYTLLAVERPERWQRAAIVREWQRLRSTAHEFNHCDGDDRVHYELVSTSVDITDPDELALHNKAFNAVAEAACFGDGAKDLIINALDFWSNG